MMESEPERLRQLVMDYYIAYYSEIRKELPKYTSDPNSKQMPVFFRTHRRYIRVTEFDDGYLIVHRTVPEDEFDRVGYWETFYIYGHHGQTLGAATGRGFPPYGDFMTGDRMLEARDEETGEYADTRPPERIEAREFISNNRVATHLTQDMAREEARKELREFFSGGQTR